jgi:hypothetical protein
MNKQEIKWKGVSDYDRKTGDTFHWQEAEGKCPTCKAPYRIAMFHTPDQAGNRYPADFHPVVLNCGHGIGREDHEHNSFTVYSKVA